MTRPPSAQPAGVSLAGAEFGTDRPTFSNQNPGTHGEDYLFNSEATIAYFAKKGFQILRIPFRWERVQPSLFQALHPAELGRLRQTADLAAKHGTRIILDLHNYGRYVLERDGKPFACVIGQDVDGSIPVPSAAFEDLWARLAAAFQGHPGVWALGLMNEPHDMGTTDWPAQTGRAVAAIRSEKSEHAVLVPGGEWSSSRYWERANPAEPWIEDPLDRCLYEAHCYFDADGSGRYALSYTAELSIDSRLSHRPADRLAPFLSWCRNHSVRGYLGEFGLPVHEPRWRAMCAAVVDLLDDAGIGWSYWAGGEWWGDYPLSLQPGDSGQDSPLLSQLRIGQ